MKVVTPEQVIEAAAKAHQVALHAYIGFCSDAPGRNIAALLCRRYT